MEDIMERLTDGKHYLLKIGAVLGVVATALGGCVINTAPEGRQNVPTQQTSTPSEDGIPEMYWEEVDNDRSAYGHPEEPGGRGKISTACLGPDKLVKLSEQNGTPIGIAAIPNSPECGYTPPTPESSPTPTAEATSTPANGN